MFTEAEASSIWDVAAFSRFFAGAPQLTRVRAIFAHDALYSTHAALVAHSCDPDTSHVSLGVSQLKVVAVSCDSRGISVCDGVRVQSGALACTRCRERTITKPQTDSAASIHTACTQTMCVNASLLLPWCGNSVASHGDMEQG